MGSLRAAATGRAEMTRTGFLAAGAAASVTLGQPPRTARAAGVTAAAPAPATAVKKILVLSGGTAHGAYEAGVIAGLPAGAAYDYICGTSIGALNGGILAAGRQDVLQQIWRHIGSRTVLDPKHAYRAVFQPSSGVGTRLVEAVRLAYDATSGSLTGIMRSEPVRAILRDVFVDRGRLRDFVTPLFWTASNLSQGCAGYFSRTAGPQNARTPSAIRSEAALRGTLSTLGFTTRTASSDPETFIEQLRASSAIPGVFEPALPQAANGDVLVDGGITNNTPFALVRAAAASGPVEVHTVLLGPSVARHRPDQLTNIAGIALACFDVMQQRLIDDAVRALAYDVRQLRTLRQSQAILKGAIDAHRTALQSMAAAAPSAAAARRLSALSRTALQTQDAALLQADAQIASAPLPNDVTIKYRAPLEPLAGTGFDFDNQANVDTNFDRGYADIRQHGWVDYVISDDLCSLGAR